MRWTRAPKWSPAESGQEPPVGPLASSGSWAIREARRADAGDVARLWQEMMDFHASFDPRFRFAPGAPGEFQQHFLATLRSREGRVLVAECEGRVVGYILGEIHVRRPLYPTGTYGFVSDIVVEEAYRQRGIGRALAGGMMDWFRRKKVTSVELFASERNPVSLGFWRALGFDSFLRLMRSDVEEVKE